MPQIYILRGAHAAAQFHLVANFLQRDFQSSEHRQQIEKIEIAQVRQAEHLALHRTLAIGEDRAEASAHILDDFGGPNSRGPIDCGHRICRLADRKMRQAQSGRGIARRFGEERSVADQVFTAQLLDVDQGAMQGHHEGSRRRVA